MKKAMTMSMTLIITIVVLLIVAAIVIAISFSNLNDGGNTINKDINNIGEKLSILVESSGDESPSRITSTGTNFPTPTTPAPF